MRLFAVAVAVVALAIGAGMVACSSAKQSVQTSTEHQAQQQVAVPDAVKVPGGNKLVGSFEGTGVQIYQCTNNAWTLLQPAAIISDNGKPIALHSKGPMWVSTIDGSSTKQLVLGALRASHKPMSAAEVSATIGISRATAHRYLAALATTGGVTVGLRYGATGRPEQEFAATNNPPSGFPR